MKTSNSNADIGDYLKVFACTAVMSQPIMSLIMKTSQPNSIQDIFGIFYNLVKYTAQRSSSVFCIRLFELMTNMENSLIFIIYVIIGQTYLYQHSGGL